MIKDSFYRIFSITMIILLLITSFSLFVSGEFVINNQKLMENKLFSNDVNENDINLFTLSFNGEQMEYSLDDLKDFPQITASGGRLKVTGEVVGPYEYTGVSMITLADEFETLPSSFDMVSISDDGYLMKYTHDEIIGDVSVYDLEGNSQGIGGVEMILAYEEDGEPLTHGGPLRIAFVNDGMITDAFLWSKYIEEIEFVYHNSDNNPPDISIDKPINAIYYFDQKFINYPQPIIIGDITFKISVFDENAISKVIFIMDERIKSKQHYSPYEWNWDERAIGKYTIQIVCYDDSGNIGIAQKDFSIINFF
jgi:hypothetical protein